MHLFQSSQITDPELAVEIAFSADAQSPAVQRTGKSPAMCFIRQMHDLSISTKEFHQGRSLLCEHVLKGIAGRSVQLSCGTFPTCRGAADSRLASHAASIVQSTTE